MIFNATLSNIARRSETTLTFPKLLSDEMTPTDLIPAGLRGDCCAAHG